MSQSSSALQLRTSSGATASLNFSPVALSVTASDGTHVLTWNADGHFAFEHTRTKQVGTRVSLKALGFFRGLF